MPSYKLIYFNGRGRAEVARLLFAQAGVAYEDCRLTQEQFGAIKDNVEKLPMGQVPVLEVDGHVLFQSGVIARYLAREFGMAGKDTLEMILVDLVFETVSDVFSQIVSIHFTKDETKKAELQKAFELKAPKFMGFFTNRLEKNSQGKGYMVGKTMTLADVSLYNILAMFATFSPMLSKYPALQSFYERMKKEPKIAAWVAKRPESAF